MIEPPSLVALVLAFVYGTLLGSFLNVVIYRLPRDLSVVVPPSSCPACGARIAWWQNIPIASFLLLGGRCRTCRVPISPRYPFVEALTGSGTAFLYGRHPFLHLTLPDAGAPFHVAIHWDAALSFAYHLIFTALLIVIYFIDLDWQLIFDAHSVGGTIVGFLGQIYYSRVTPGAWLDSLIGLAGGALFFQAIAVVSRWIFKQEAMGGGDVKFAALIGAFLGWKLAFTAFFLAFFIGSVWGITLILLRKKKRREYIPFGPSMALGAFVGLFWGERLLDAYLDFLGRGLVP